MLLPVRGLVQTLPRAWRDFLAELVNHSPQVGTLPAPGTQEEVAAHGTASPDGSAALVLIGGPPDLEALADVISLLPLLALACAREQALEIARAQAAVARQAAADARGLAEALDVSRRALQLEVRTREDFLAVTAHDLKNPLGVIKGIGQLLRRQLDRPTGLAPERLRAGLDTIESAVNQLVSQVDELLDVARLQMGQPLDLQRTSVDLVALVRQVVAGYQGGTERHDVRVETAEERLVGEWDARRLARVIGNLLGNAVKYSPEGGAIAVEILREAGTDGDQAILRLRDQGIGIPAADLPRLFQRFRRAQNVIGRIPGAGIGLAASRQLVEQHDGTVEVESTEGVGSTFTVRLPLRVQDPPVQETRAVNLSPGHSP